ncbi:MAG: NADH-quinone oxidoreductase subunit I [Ignavibacteriales bacterium]|nr:NADH-quinone oxidoreductase subunit I [Ignavibacteriales bacterium]
MQQYFRDIFVSIWTVLIGMRITFMHMFKPTVTIQYPDVRRPIPERARNRLYVNMDDCIGCLQCDLACPVNCFEIETVKSLPTDDLGMTSTGQKKKLWVTEFTIDIGKCCYCGLCTYPCPTECIKMTDVYEFSEYKRHDLIYNYVTLTQGEISEVKAKAAEMEKEAAAKKAAAAAAAKAAAPAGMVPVVAKPATPTVASTPKPVATTTAKPVEAVTETVPAQNTQPTNTQA